MSSSQGKESTPDKEAAKGASKKKGSARGGSKKGKATSADPFERLETQVRLAVSEIERLRRVNGELRSEIAELVAVARRQEEEASSAQSADPSEETQSQAAAWEAERAEIRERVEGLVEGLEQLLAAAEEE